MIPKSQWVNARFSRPQVATDNGVRSNWSSVAPHTPADAVTSVSKHTADAAPALLCNARTGTRTCALPHGRRYNSPVMQRQHRDSNLCPATRLTLHQPCYATPAQGLEPVPCHTADAALALLCNASKGPQTCTLPHGWSRSCPVMQHQHRDSNLYPYHTANAEPALHCNDSTGTRTCALPHA